MVRIVDEDKRGMSVIVAKLAVLESLVDFLLVEECLRQGNPTSSAEAARDHFAGLFAPDQETGLSDEMNALVVQQFDDLFDRVGTMVERRQSKGPLA